MKFYYLLFVVLIACTSKENSSFDYDMEFYKNQCTSYNYLGTKYDFLGMKNHLLETSEIDEMLAFIKDTSDLNYILTKRNGAINYNYKKLFIDKNELLPRNPDFFLGGKKGTWHIFEDSETIIITESVPLKKLDDETDFPYKYNGINFFFFRKDKDNYSFNEILSLDKEMKWFMSIGFFNTNSYCYDCYTDYLLNNGYKMKDVTR